MEQAIDVSDNIKRLPAKLNTKLEEIAFSKMTQGTRVLDLASSVSDLPTPQRVIKKYLDIGVGVTDHSVAKRKLRVRALKTAISNWYEARYNVLFDPNNEVTFFSSKKLGFMYLCQSLLNSSDGVIIPNPSPSVYQISTVIAGGVPFYTPLFEENDFHPDLSTLDRRTVDRSKLLFTNFPSNPTTAMGSEELFEQILDFSNKTNIVVCNDNSFSELYFGDSRPAGFFQQKRAKNELAVEIHSLATTYSMFDIPLAFMVGRSEVIEAVEKMASRLEEPPSIAAIEAAITSLSECWTDIEDQRKVFQLRKEKFCAALKKTTLEFREPKGTYYVWAKVPLGFNADTFAEHLVRHSNILVKPGTAFGSGGQGYVRFSITVPDNDLVEAAYNISNVLERK